MAKLKAINIVDKGEEYAFQCPACQKAHWVRVDESGFGWDFNGDFEKPTFWPSVRIQKGADICNFSITEGEIKYLDDSTHDLKGQTIPLSDWPESP